MDSCKPALLVISAQPLYIALQNGSVNHRALQAGVDLHLQGDGRAFCAGYRRYNAEMPMRARTAAEVDSGNALTDWVSHDANIGDCVGRYRLLYRVRIQDPRPSNIGVSVFGGFLPE